MFLRVLTFSAFRVFRGYPSSVLSVFSVAKNSFTLGNFQ